MTWTVTALGTAGTLSTVTSLTKSGLTINIGDGIAVFVEYSDFQTDTISVTDNASPPNTYIPVDNVFDASGQLLASFYCASCAHSATSITASYATTPVIQNFGVIKFTNSVAGTPTLDGHSGLDNSTGTSTPNSGTGTATNGDLVLTGVSSDGTVNVGYSSLAITGVTSPTIQNNNDANAGYADGSGVTTTTGSVTSTWTVTGGAHAFVVLQMFFKPPSAAPSGVPVWLYTA